jgi:4-amino-4-deoxy-L-arabinose transferase-like glycosyltransferase
MTRRPIIILLVLTVAAFGFKYWFISLVPQPIMFDQDEYLNYARQMMSSGLIGVTSRTFGYPLFIVVNFLLFGLNNIRAIVISQIVIDIGTGLLLFVIGRKLFGNLSGWIALIIQFFNPFTTAFTGVILTEVTAAFMIILLFTLLTLFLNYRLKPTPAYILYLIFGMILGLLTQSRPQFLYWGILMCVALPFITKQIKKIPAILILLAGFIFASFYQIAGNVNIFHQFSFTTVDNAGARELYDGILVKNAPLFPNNPYAYPPQMVEMYAEYSVLPKTPQDRKLMAQKYYGKAFDLIRANPGDYLFNRITKMWTMWQKQNIFFYDEPGFDQHWIYTYSGNLIMLILSVCGFIMAFRIKKNPVRMFVYFSLGLIAFMTLSISLTHAEPRLTIPVYPLLFLYSSVTVNSLVKHFLKKTTA